MQFYELNLVFNDVFNPVSDFLIDFPKITLCLSYRCHKSERLKIVLRQKQGDIIVRELIEKKSQIGLK